MSHPRLLKQALLPGRAVATEQLQRPDFWVLGSKGSSLSELSIKHKSKVGSIARVMFSEKHITSMNSQDALGKEYHPLRELALTKWAERKDPLWWNVLSKTEVSPRVVRGWAINRTRVAFKNALKRKGYDENGYRLNDPSGSKRPEKDLVGSVQFMINQGAVKASWEEMNAEADMILDGMLQTLEKKPSAAKKKKKTISSIQEQKPASTRPSFSIKKHW